MSSEERDHGAARPADQNVDLEKLLEERARLEELIHKSFTRTITVMFTDFRGSVAIAESEGDVTTRLLIKQHHDILLPLIREHNGVVVKTMGDGTLSYFNKAQESVRAAVAFQKELKEFNKGRAGKTQVLVRVGLNTGAAIVEENDIFGDVVNIAARFEQMAGPSQVFMSETTHMSLENRDEFRCLFVKTTEIKGKVGLHKVYRVRWDDEEPAEPAADTAPAAPNDAEASAARPSAAYPRLGAATFGAAGTGPAGRRFLGAPFLAGKQAVNQKRRLDGDRIREEIESVESATREIRALVVRSGETHRIADEGYRVFDDIVIESGGLLVVENAKLFFAESAGIVSAGTLRARSSLFSAIEPAAGWRNVALAPHASRVNQVDKCTFRFGRGRTPAELSGDFGRWSARLIDGYRYGGGLLVAGAPDKILSLSDTVFSRCQASEGGGTFLLEAALVLSGCTFDLCKAGVSGGGLLCIDSAPMLSGCRFTVCSAEKGGGGMAIQSSKATISTCTFERCSTRFLYGGGLLCAGSTATVAASRFNRCSAVKDGGGIYCDDAGVAKVVQTTLVECLPNGSNDAAKDGASRKRGW